MKRLENKHIHTWKQKIKYADFPCRNPGNMNIKEYKGNQSWA